MTDTTLYRRLTDRADQDPDARMFIEPVAKGYRHVTRRELLQQTDGIIDLLRRAEVGEGDCVAVWLPNWSTASAWQFAASAVGAHVIGVNTRYNVVEVQHILRKARPRVLVMAHAFRRLDLLDRGRQSVEGLDAELIPLVVPVPAPGETLPGDVSAYDLGGGVDIVTDDLSSERPKREPVGPDQERLAVAFTTSGSTGMPKLAAHREAAVLWHAEAVHSRIGFRPEDVLVGALPYSGVFGYSAAMAALEGGASVLMHPAFDPELLLQEMAQFGATHYVGADDMLQRLRLQWESAPQELSSWRWIGIADFEGKSQAIAAWAAQEFGTETVGVYGSSELLALTAFWNPETDPAHRWGGGGNLVAAEVRVRIVDPLDDRPVTAGEEGELQFSGPNVVDVYLGDTGEAASAFTGDGWFRSGDLGVASDDDGFIYVCRMGDVLRLKGFLVDPSEIERRLAEHPSVHTAKTVGVQDADGQMQAIGYVTLRDDVDPVAPEELRTWCAEALARFKVPAAIEVIEQMPTTAGTNGTKIRAAELREWAQQRYGAAAD